MPETIDPVFAKTSQNARFLLSENERFGLVFVKTGSINSGTGVMVGVVEELSTVTNMHVRFRCPKLHISDDEPLVDQVGQEGY